MGEVAVAEAGDPIPVRAPVSQQLGERKERGPEVTICLLTGTKQRENPAHILLQKSKCKALNYVIILLLPARRIRIR